MGKVLYVFNLILLCFMVISAVLLVFAPSLFRIKAGEDSADKKRKISKFRLVLYCIFGACLLFFIVVYIIRG